MCVRYHCCSCDSAPSWPAFGAVSHPIRVSSPTVCVVYKYFMPKISGTENAATSHSTRVADSSGRRIKIPQCPPVRCCSINSPSEPSDNPSTNRNAIRYDRKKSSGLVIHPTMDTTRPSTPTTSARFSNRPTLSGALYSCALIPLLPLKTPRYSRVSAAGSPAGHSPWHYGSIAVLAGTQ